MKLRFSAQQAYIFRITHRDNVPWIVRNGIHCRNSTTVDPNFVAIGNAELIDKRRNQLVPVVPGGTLGDYVPFYFTPYSVMMYQIKTGHNGIRRRKNEEIAIIVTSLPKLQEGGMNFLYTDRHASLRTANFYSDIADLSALDWNIWNGRDFKNDPEDPEKKDRYQAEALVHRHVPVSGILGIVCYSPAIATDMARWLGGDADRVKIGAQSNWYF